MIIWMIVIFILSAQNADESSGTSGSLLSFILKITYPGYKQMNNAEQFIILEAYQHVIRKFAHFFIFGILGALAVNAYKSLRLKNNGHVILLSFVTCVIYAVLDEVHQIFVPGRSCEIMDIVIDSSGAFIFIAITIFIFYLIDAKKSRHMEKP
ncbi:MAG TPA: VanZ family protein [Clostridia bacterium]|nr:VanZ family protein [Clostridia bacterium]